MSITDKLAQAVSTPAVEVTADAVDDALAAAEFEGGLDARSCMQAALAAAYPALVQQVERLTAEVAQLKGANNGS
jgi:hypothetical protein